MGYITSEKSNQLLKELLLNNSDITGEKYISYFINYNGNISLQEIFDIKGEEFVKVFFKKLTGTDYVNFADSDLFITNNWKSIRANNTGIY